MFKSLFKKLDAATEPIKTEDDFYFKAAGVTFENRQDLLTDIADTLRSQIDTSVLYAGLRNKDIKELESAASELESVWFDVDLVETTFDGSVAFEIQNDGDVLGFIPKDSIQQFIDYRNKFTYLKAKASLTGGKVKKFDIDTEKVILERLTYGLLIHCHFFGVV